MSHDETAERFGVVSALARQHLPAPAADDLLATLRPALRLVHASGDQHVVGHLGGQPSLTGASWPWWEGRGPARLLLLRRQVRRLQQRGRPPGPVDGARLPGAAPTGRARRAPGPDDTPERPGALPGGAPRCRPHAHLAGSRGPGGPGRVEGPRPVGPRAVPPLAPVHAFHEALRVLPGGGDTHQIGGHPSPQQSAVELEAELLQRGLDARLQGARPFDPRTFDWDDPAVLEAALRWQLLLQVASDDDAEMMWGDAGQLYFLVRSPGEPEDALFTWQCG